MIPRRLAALVELIEALPAPVLFPVHPRTARTARATAGCSRASRRSTGLQLTEPLGYAEFSALVCQARAVLTDSGGVQKEAYLAGVPCVTLRANTEWVETVAERLEHARRPRPRRGPRGAATPPRPPSAPQLYGDGHAAERCVRGDRGAVSESPPSAPSASAWSGSATGARTWRATSP